MTISKFLFIGYVIGIPISALTIYDIATLKRRAFRISGHHKLRWISWAIAGLFSGWGAPIIGLFWLLGNSRHDAIDVEEKQRRA